MNLRNLLSSHHLPEEEGGDGGGGGIGGGTIDPSNSVKTAGRLHIAEAPSAFTRIAQAHAPRYPSLPDKPYPSDNARLNAAANSIFRAAREASSGEGIDEVRARRNIADRVLKTLDGFDNAGVKPHEMQSAVDYLYKNRNYTVDESGNLLPWEKPQDDVVTRQNRKEGIIHSTPEKPAEGAGINTEFRGRQILKQ